MTSNPEPREGQIFEAVDGERRTVLAVDIVNRQYVARYHSSHRSDDEFREASMTAWKRWMTDHDAKLIVQSEPQ